MMKKKKKKPKVLTNMVALELHQYSLSVVKMTLKAARMI